LKNNPDKLLTNFQAVFDTYDKEITNYLYPVTLPFNVTYNSKVSLFRGSFDNAAAASLFNESYEKAEDSLGLLLEYSLIDFDPKSSRYTQNELVRYHKLPKNNYFVKLKLHALSTAYKEVDPATIAEWKTRLVNHYIKLFTDLNQVTKNYHKFSIFLD
jgi:hypothetical protein